MRYGMAQQKIGKVTNIQIINHGYMLFRFNFLGEGSITRIPRLYRSFDIHIYILAIIKSFKTFVPKICGEEYGHMVLLAAFDCVDDTKLIAKAIISEIIGEGKEATSEKLSEAFASEKAGRKVLLYLIGMLLVRKLLIRDFIKNKPLII